MHPMKSVFIINAYNEIHHLPALIAEVKATAMACTTVLLVNNGSTDGTEKVIRDSGLPYIENAVNLGANAGFQSALKWALRERYDVFGGIAGNGKMLPSEAGRLLEPILSGRADYVTGSRFLQGGATINLPTFRKQSIPWVNKYVKFLTGQSVSDATGGYRAFKLDLIRRATFDWNAEWLRTYGLEYYLYCKVLMDPSVRWTEVPVTSRYPAKGVPYSKLSPGRDWYDMLKPWIVARLDGKGFTPA